MASISIKRVLLGSAAGILATATAQAADLPVKKAAAVQYVKVCPAYGSGFFEIPGTDMCIRIFGSMKVNFPALSPAKEFAFISQSSTGVYSISHFKTSAFDLYTHGLSARPGVDVRSPTEWGTLRTVIQMRFDYGGGQDGPPPNGDAAQKTTNLCYRCYIEFAGITMGRVGSAFPYFNEDDIIAKTPTAKNNINAIWYTWQGPAGWNGRIALEDPLVHSAKGFFSTREAGLNLAAPGGAVAVTRGPLKGVDVIGILNTEGTWGNATVRAAAHHITTIARGPTGGALPAFSTACPAPAGLLACTSTLPTNNDWGWAASAGAYINLPTLGPKDTIMAQVTYGVGATDYVGINGGEVAMGTFDNSQTIIAGMNFDHHDAIYINNGDGTYRPEKETAWSLQSKLLHYWAPRIRSNLFFGYAEITPGTTTRNTDWTLGGLGKASTWRAGANVWFGEQRKTSELGLEIFYGSTRQNVPGINGAPSTNALPSGLSANGSNWNMAMEWSRNF
jgi:hypothetical protein